MSPNVLPVQILTVGNVAMVAVPFEMTTMAGRRLRETVHARLAPRGVDTVVIAGLSNSYAGYLATREEYARQDYEGASTHFGPWTLAALQQEFARVAEAMSAGAEVELGPIPKDPGELKTADLPDRPDALPDGVRFGQVVEDRDARDTYTPGQTVSVTFWGGLPRNRLRTEGSFLEVQRQDTAGAWQPVAYDWDWETQYHWQRYPCPPRGACSQATVVWNIPDSAEPGTYRLQHDGDWRDDHGKVHPYTGVSREFTVRAE
jgi:neutral ceramidase